MPIVCGCKFRGAGKVYFFRPNDSEELANGDSVIVQTSRGAEMAEVIQAPHEVPKDEVVGKLKPILRKATSLDLLDSQRHRRQEPKAVARCQEEITRAGLPMKVVGAEYSFDGSRLTFFFSSEKRVDFRALVRELARVFKTRIELRQIGVRDEAKIMGGVGKCGRELCCATWLPGFAPVSIRMAKAQDLPLSPMEISGICGRLLCCLRYENDMYQSIKKQFPRVGKTIDTPLGSARVLRVSVIRETALMLLEDGSRIELTREQLLGEEPIDYDENGKPRSKAEMEQAMQSISLPLSIPEPAPKEEQPQKKSSRSRRRKSRSRKPRSDGSGSSQSQPDQQKTEKEGDGSQKKSKRSRSSRRRRGRRSNRNRSSQGGGGNSQGGSGGNQPKQGGQP